MDISTILLGLITTLNDNGRKPGPHKVGASIVDQVHLTIHQGHVMPIWMRFILFR
jgi:hypothetical protein